MSIRNTEATRFRFTCDACDATTSVYNNRSVDGDEFPEPDEWPDGWVSYPHHRFMGAEQLVVLCPNHAHLVATTVLIKRILRLQEDKLAVGDNIGGP